MKKTYCAPVVASTDAVRETLTGVTKNPMHESLFSSSTPIGFGL